MNQAQVRAVLDFWFSHGWDDWWKPNPAFDAEIRERFRELWEKQRENRPELFLGSADEALAAVILFDQFPRNMFRGHADQFATDPLALAIARAAIDKGYDDGMTPERRGFLYMPFQHSEELRDQRQSLLLFTALGNAEQLGYRPQALRGDRALRPLPAPQRGLGPQADRDRAGGGRGGALVMALVVRFRRVSKPRWRARV